MQNAENGDINNLQRPHLQDDDLEGSDAQHEPDVARHLPATLAQPPKALPPVCAALSQLTLLACTAPQPGHEHARRRIN